MVLTPGEPALSFHGHEKYNQRYAFDTAAGRYIVLTFLNENDENRAFANMMANLPYFDDNNGALFFVTQTPVGESQLPLRIPGVRAFYDTDKKIERLYKLKAEDPRPISFIISPRFQIIGIVSLKGQDHVNQVNQLLSRLPDVENLPNLHQHAPVLMIPYVFERELCQELIKRFESTGGGTSSGFMRDIEGKTKEIHDKNHKIRKDWEINDKELIQIIQNRFFNRVVPEIKRAFQFEASRMERYIVACYNQQDGGYFRPHRDNTTKGTMHRRFAVSLNLNAEDYEGGNLRFPEFGRRTYRPPTGGCVVFSCSLLHEATDITQGRRFVFLPFLYDEAARKVREANFAHIDETVVSKYKNKEH